MVGTIAAVIALGGKAVQRHHAPRWLDQTIAGRGIGDDIALYDPKSHFMVVGGGECDGAIRSILLTSDRYEVSGMGYQVPNFKPSYGKGNGSQDMKTKHVPLRTGIGLKIGDSESRVLRRLGRPRTIEASGSRGQFLVYRYQWHSKRHGPVSDPSYEPGREYDESYTFKHGQLIEVHFGSYSDETG